MCELTLPDSVSVLVVKLWDLVKMLELIQFQSNFIEKSQNSVDSIFLRWMILCARDLRIMYTLLSVAYVCALLD